MHTTSTKDTSTSTPSSQPFFSQRIGGFFSPEKEAAKPFFSPAVVQPKLTINEPGDRYEQEADAMAERVMRMSQPASEGSTLIQTKPLNLSSIQRQCSSCKENERLQRQEMEDDETLQAKPLMRKSAQDGGFTASPQLSSQLHSSKGGGEPLPGKTLASMNQAFGADFSTVRIHTGSQAAEMSQGIQAKAFTHGSDVYFNQGQYSPETSEGKRLLGHELTHVVQVGGINKNIQSQTNSLLIQAKLFGCPTYQNIDAPDALCVTEKSRSLSPKCQLTSQQEQLLSDSKSRALAKVIDVEYKISGYHYNYKRQDIVDKLTDTFFGLGRPLDVRAILDILNGVIKTLSGSKIKFQGATCGDPNCRGEYLSQGRKMSDGPLDAYVTKPGKMPIFICPKAFLNIPELLNTIMHESFHLAGTTHNVNIEREKYCSDESPLDTDDCRIGCGDKNAASTWVKFINCFDLLNNLQPIYEINEALISDWRPPMMRK